MWRALRTLSRICTGPTPGPGEIVEACGVIREALSAEDAYVIRAGDPAFVRIGCPCDTDDYEIKQKGYYLVWRSAASNPEYTAGLFNVEDGRVSAGRAIREDEPTTHVGAILPGDESNSELLIIRGPWRQGLSAEQVAFVEAARPIMAYLVSNVLDAERQARQRAELESLANVSKAFNEAHETDDVLVALATALAKASSTDWVTITVFSDACDAVVDRAMNRARYSSTRIAEQYREGQRRDSPAEIEFGIDMTANDRCVLVPDVFDPTLPDWPEVAPIRDAIPGLQEYWKRAHVLSVAMLPMVFQRKALGFLAFSSSKSRAFDAEEVAFLQALAAQAATVIKGLRLYQELQASQEEVHKREEWFRSLVQNTSDLITVIKPDTTIVYQSPAITTVLGYEADAAVGQKLLDVIHHDDQGPFLAALTELMTKPGAPVVGQGRVRHRDGAWRHLEFTGTDQRANAAINGLVMNVRDITERKLMEEQLRHQALHDPLTNLANRTRFNDRLEHTLLRSTRTKTQVAVLFMDLDNFKAVNDSLGHTAGDLLLTRVAERVQACLREIDTVARLGGDEFAILLEDIESTDDAVQVTERVFETLRQSFHLEGKDLLVRASVGIAVSYAGAKNAEALVRDADTAMYVAKSRGKGRYEIFEESMQVSMMERLELLADLQQAVERREFVLEYQPIFLIETGALYGVEALVRWSHPKRGTIAPGEFISLAEESGAILGLGQWVLEEACRQSVAWQQAYPERTGWTISVNVSVKQLQHPDFVQDVERTLTESGLAPERLILEITESVMMQDAPAMMERLRALKATGVRLAIDDFGTGYSSLSYLREFPFDLLKIDKAFIDDVAMITDRKDLTSAIIELGKTLKLELVAEGIEDSDQLERLTTLECDLGQGFFFAKPLSAEAVGELLAAEAGDVRAA
jgi:diguanylate cyclase (GGDEF)-like protein/PAS domain S-box-containing protein